MTDERPADSPYAAPASRIAPGDAAGLPPILARFLCTLAVTLIPSTAVMLASMGSSEDSIATRFVVIMLLWALPSWFILWPTFRASGGWRHTQIRTRVMVPCLFAIALGMSTFVLSIVASVVFSIYSRVLA
ncbi:MAG TPA: hypothetical protein VGE64_06855 [Xanthomonadaceae bacterium]